MKVVILTGFQVQAILDLVEDITRKTEDKIVIVSQWTSVLGIISNFLEDRTTSYDTIDGTVNVVNRQTIANRFNDENSTKPRVNTGLFLILLSPEEILLQFIILPVFLYSRCYYCHLLLEVLA